MNTLQRSYKIYFKKFHPTLTVSTLPDKQKWHITAHFEVSCCSILLVKSKNE